MFRKTLRQPIIYSIYKSAIILRFLIVNVVYCTNIHVNAHIELICFFLNSSVSINFLGRKNTRNKRIEILAQIGSIYLLIDCNSIPIYHIIEQNIRQITQAVEIVIRTINLPCLSRQHINKLIVQQTICSVINNKINSLYLTFHI